MITCGFVPNYIKTIFVLCLMDIQRYIVYHEMFNLHYVYAMYVM